MYLFSLDAKAQKWKSCSSLFNPGQVVNNSVDIASANYDVTGEVC